MMPAPPLAASRHPWPFTLGECARLDWTDDEAVPTSRQPELMK
jgi:hypothetical protein